MKQSTSLTLALLVLLAQSPAFSLPEQPKGWTLNLALSPHLMRFDSATSFTQEKDLPAALASLVAAERAFAATSVEKGVRESFLAFFADDGINFQPHPVKTREAFLKQPAPPTRPQVTLNWEPIYADVSQAGDLGYTTGPYTLTDESPQPRPPRHGYYFSVWKKQADGSWKVVLDIGITTPAPDAPRPSFQAARQRSAKPAGKVNLEAERSALMSLEREFAKASASRGLASAFLSSLDDEARLHKNGVFPLVGKEVIQSFLAGKSTVLTWAPLKADVSVSGDLGYAYGSYELKEASSQTAASEKGYYAHVWKRGVEGKWRLVIEVSNPLPPEQKN